MLLWRVRSSILTGCGAIGLGLAPRPHTVRSIDPACIPPDRIPLQEPSVGWIQRACHLVAVGVSAVLVPALTIRTLCRDPFDFAQLLPPEVRDEAPIAIRSTGTKMTDVPDELLTVQPEHPPGGATGTAGRRDGTEVMLAAKATPEVMRQWHGVAVETGISSPSMTRRRKVPGEKPGRAAASLTRNSLWPNDDSWAVSRDRLWEPSPWSEVCILTSSVAS